MKETEKITTTEAAKRLGLSRFRVFQFIKEERLPATKVGRDWLINADDLKSVADREPGRPAFILLEDTAERLKVTVKEVQRLIERGDLITKRNAQSVLVVKLKSVEEYLQKKKSARKK